MKYLLIFVDRFIAFLLFPLIYFWGAIDYLICKTPPVLWWFWEFKKVEDLELKDDYIECFKQGKKALFFKTSAIEELMKDGKDGEE